MFFSVEFDDGDKVLLPYSKDLSSAVQFEEFVYSEPQLFPLRFNAADAPKRVTAMKREPIRNIALYDVFYLDLRYWGYEWFDALDLPNAYSTTYVVPCEYVAWQTRRRYQFVQVRCPLFDEVLHTLWDHYYVFIYMVRSAPSPSHIRLSMSNFVCSTLTFYPIATAIVCLPSLQHVFDYTSYRDGGRRGRHCCSIAAA